jgi:NAD(P)-dependent dehydrogenase (short-subunit alcohol dehydrogenase family)
MKGHKGMEKKTAVIIGADGRLNALLAEAMRKRDVAATTLTGQGPQSGEDFIYTSQEELTGLCEQIAREKSAADYLIVSVLTDPDERRDVLHETDSPTWQAAKQRSMDMVCNAARTLIAPMAQRGCGRALFIGAIGGAMSAAGQSVSSAMSAGVMMLMQAIAVEGGDKGIVANALLLGPMEGCWGGMSTDERLISHIPLKRAGRAQEAVSVALWTLLDAPDYFTGNVLRLDGALAGGYMRNW